MTGGGLADERVRSERKDRVQAEKKMSIPGQLCSDRCFKWTIILGVVLVLGGSVGSQLLMQVGGSPRHEPLDFSKQLPEALKGVRSSPTGCRRLSPPAGSTTRTRQFLTWGWDWAAWSLPFLPSSSSSVPPASSGGQGHRSYGTC